MKRIRHSRFVVIAGVATGFLLAAPDTLGLDWQRGDGFRYAPLAVPKEGVAGFASLAAQVTGVAFTNHLGPERGLTNMVLWNGSGVAAGDVDGDGLCDLYFCNLEGPNALFRNLGGWRFTNITVEAGVTCVGQQSTGAAFVDVDSDGHPDLLVSSIGQGVRLFTNDGQGRFKETTAAAGLASNTGSMTLALADIDGNGTLDLYVANYRKDTFQDQPGVSFTVAVREGKHIITHIDGKPVSLTPDANRYSIGEGMTVIEDGEPDVLYRNDGHGRFSPVSWTDGSFLDEDGRPLTEAPSDWGLSATFRDLNGDGAPDLYVCNDTHSPDRIWINLSPGQFRALPRLALRQTSYSSMGVDFADLNRDGFDEFLVTDMLWREHTNLQAQITMRRPLTPPGVFDNRPDYQRNTLFLNRGDGTYAEIAQFSGIDATDWTWSPVFLDVDLDGYEDLLITTGHAWNLLHIDTRMRIDLLRRRERLSTAEFHGLRKMYKPYDCPNYAFRNRGDLTFEDTREAWHFDSRQVTQGLCLADLDNDGDLDVAINSFDQPALVYRNETIAPRLAVRLRGKPGNAFGIGAHIRVLGGPVPQSQQMICGGRYVSSDEPVRTFAAGHLTNRLSIEVAWRSGLITLITNALPNHQYELHESRAQAPLTPTAPLTSAEPHFKDVSDRLTYTHHQESFDDSARQPSLTKRLSRFGPGVSWFDLDGDELEDLLIGAGRGGSPGLFRNLGGGRFEPFNLELPLAPDDQASLLGFSAAFGSNAVLLAQSSYQTGNTNATLCYERSAQALILRETLPASASSTGPLAMADLNGDGSLDLFVGDRVIPGRYPAPASSRLFLGEGGGFRLDELNSSALREVGLVNGAVFADLHGNGAPDLVLACEWGPIRVFRNDHGKLVPWNTAVTFRKSDSSAAAQATTLDEMTGWWQGVTAGDFDGDGRLDIAAANWGRNGRYQRHIASTLQVYYGDPDGDGVVEYLEAYYDSGLRKVVPWKRWPQVAALFPFVQARVRTFDQFSTMGVDEILLEVFPRMSRLQVNTVESLILLNRGGRFEAVPLPAEAQFAPAFGVCAGDLDGDGAEDLFLSQNFFGVDPDTARHDAGRGLWLRGDGRGGFQAVSGQSSGILVYGEGRGAALCDYDGDGRVDLVVAQNGAAAKLYHNERARPALRVRLVGTASNPLAIGAVLRLGDDGRLGPAREIHLGSGYLSQDSAVSLLGSAFDAKQIHVRWPGGRVTTSEIPPAARAIAIDGMGRVREAR